VLAGVVMRSDLVIDGFALGRCSQGGDDATRSIAALYRKLRRNDVNLIMVSGAILSLYNIIDISSLSRSTKVPVLCLTYKETKGIESSIIRHFPDSYEDKLTAYRKLGNRTRVKLNSGHVVYARGEHIETEDVKKVLDTFTLQGSIPEPVRVAKLLARAALRRS